VAATKAAQTQVAITGVGMFTPVGSDAVQSASSVRAGINRFAGWPHFGLTFGDDTLVASCTRPDLRDGPWNDKVLDLLTPVVAEALFAANRLDGGRPGAAGASRTSLFVATPYPDRPATPDEALDNVAEDLREQLGETFGFGAIEVVSLDHAGGLAALARAVDALNSREADVCVVAGVDSLLHAEVLHILLEQRRLKTPVNSAGLIPGEGAAALVLERTDRPRRRVPVLARLASVALEREPTELRPADGLRAEALSRAIQAALASIDPATIHRVVVDLNGERWRAREWAMAETRCLSELPDGWQLWHPADCWGDIGAASGVAHVALAARAFARGYGGAGGVLICGSSTGGERAAATVLAPEGGR
jgi:3-oxoacyl-[acyl-carrier-protein] synthase-1